MAQSANELKIIHTRNLATPGRKYYGDDDKVYIGTKDGRLRLLEKASEVITNSNSNVQISLSTNDEAISEIELQLQSSSLLKSTKLTYDSQGNIIQKEVFADATEAEKLFDVTFSYNSDDNIDSIDVIRMSDGYSYNKELLYDSEFNVTNINTTKNE